MQTTHHAGKIAAIQQSFVPRIVASHLLLSRKQVSPSFTSPAHLVVRQKKSKLLLDSLHAWWRKMPRYPKIQTGRMVQLCTESVGRTLLLQCWRSGGGRHNAAEKALCAICLGNKNSLCSSAASAVHCCMGLSALAFWTTLIRKRICAISWAYCRNNLPTVLMNSCHGT